MSRLCAAALAFALALPACAQFGGAAGLASPGQGAIAPPARSPSRGDPGPGFSRFPSTPSPRSPYSGAPGLLSLPSVRYTPPAPLGGPTQGVAPLSDRRRPSYGNHFPNRGGAYVGPVIIGPAIWPYGYGPGGGYSLDNGYGYSLYDQPSDPAALNSAPIPGPDPGPYPAFPQPFTEAESGYPAPPPPYPGPQAPNALQPYPGTTSPYPAQSYPAPQPYPNAQPYPGPAQLQPAPLTAPRMQYIPDPADTVTLIFKDGRPPEQITSYLATRSTLTVINGRRHREIPLAELDLPATRKANLETGVTFDVPSTP